jgi:hypothetical protein
MNILLPWTNIRNTPYPSSIPEYYVRLRYWPDKRKYPGMLSHIYFYEGKWMVMAFNINYFNTLYEDLNFNNPKEAASLESGKIIVDNKLIQLGWKLLNENDSLMLLL